MWDSKTIAVKIRTSESKDLLHHDQIHLKLFSPEKQIGVGADGEGNTVLVLPGQKDVLAFQTEFASYDPWSNLVIFESKKRLDGVSILRCNIELLDQDTVEAAAAIFLGLIDLEKQFGKTGKAIWQLKALFENRLKFEISEKTLIGLIGELLIIFLSTNSATAIKFWHSNIDDKFDFSGANFRLEVKSTTGTSRNHHFSSYQIPGDAPGKTLVASVKISKVENGNSIVDLLKTLESELEAADYLKLRGIVNSTLGVPPELVSHFQIDLDSSLQSVVLIDSFEIPRPDSNDGVISMEWLATLDGISSMVSFYEDFFEKRA